MFLTIKKIPKTSWSSPKPLNFKPQIITFIYFFLQKNASILLKLPMDLDWIYGKRINNIDIPI